MTPYRHVPYWKSQWRKGQRARTKEEKFNRHHAYLRNVVERTFGVLKARFPILQRMPSYSFATQRNIVVACMAIHDFLRRVALNDKLFRTYENVDLQMDDEAALVDQEEMDLENDNDVFGEEDRAYMVNLRNQIANQLVADELVGNHPPEVGCRGDAVVTQHVQGSGVASLEKMGRVAEFDSPARLLEDKYSMFSRLVAEYSSRSSGIPEF